MTTLELHPLCTLFPRITGDEFEALKSDIQANGMRQPIVVHDGFILDGGNRYRACMEIGIEPEAVEFAGDNLVSYVLSVNLHRRHLSSGQQAAIVASATDWGKAQTHGGNRQAVTLPLDTVANRAAESGASYKTQRMADAVARKSPELARQVAHGEISLPKAHDQISEKKPEPENFGPSDNEIAQSLQAETEQLDYIKELLSNDEDPLTKALADVKMYREQVRVAQAIADGLSNEKNQLIRTIKSLQAKLRKLEVAA